MTEETEEWRQVAGTAEYAISNLGRVKRITTGRILRAAVNRGYRYVSIPIGDARRTLRIHRVVCEAFHGPAPSPKHQVAHNDGSTHNNRAENLRWATTKENIADKHRHGTMPLGERHPQSKLAADDVLAIRASPLRTGLLAELHGVSSFTILAVRNGNTWQHLREAA